MIRTIIFYSLILKSFSFKWQLTDPLPGDEIITFSERYMFGSRNGPKIMEQGQSYIDVNARVMTYNLRNESNYIGVAIFGVIGSKNHKSAVDTLCQVTPNTNYYDIFFNVQENKFKTEYLTTQYLYDKQLELNGTYHIYDAHVKFKYLVNEPGWYNVALSNCHGQVGQINGFITFKNPYGYLPGELYGFLPFEAARMILFVLFGVYFFYRYFRYKSTVLPLHNGIVFVYLIALTEAITWYSAYQNINLTGEPYCCPFPPTVIASLILQVFRQTLARTFLLVVCLGYGIVRPKLMASEWVAITLVSILYFITATINQVANIVITNDVHNNYSHNIIPYQVPGFIVDVIVITWIYYALGSTIRILTEFQQTAKLSMYTRLSFVIVSFVFLFAAVAILILLDKSQIITWPWQLAWAKDVLWESLNFAVLVSACIICLPSETSKLLSYASQLPTEDPDDEMDTRSHGLNIGPDSGEYFDDDEGYELTGGQTGNSYGGNFSSLPTADDEEFGLQDK